MKREGSKLKMPRAKFRIFAALLYILIIAGFITYVFTPKTADASSEERLFIPKIGLIARVKNIDRQGSKLIAPDAIAGAYQPTNHKTVIIGHSSTIFKDLKNLSGNETFTFDSKKYKIIRREIVEKKFVDMAEIVAETQKNTVVLMTCYGESLGGQDYSHRLIITAEEV
jgi:LPXTG-site transpeptidase (sortase) family protein